MTEAATDRAADLSDITVLFVENDPELAEMAASVLSPRVKALRLARDGQEGILAFARFEPDVVVSQIRLEKRNGLSLAASIRELRPDASIVFATSQVGTETLRQAIRLGAVNYLLKPYGPEELLKAVVAAAGPARKSRELDKQKRLNELLLSGLPHPAVLVDRTDETARSANPAAREIGIAPGTPLAGTPLAGVLARAEKRPAGRPAAPGGSGTTPVEIEIAGRVWDVSLDLLTEDLALLSAMDVTDRQRMQEALAKEKTFIAAILENAYDGTAVLTPRGRVTFLSPGMERLLGFTANDIPDLAAWVSKTMSDPREQAMVMAAFAEDAARESPSERIFSLVHPSGARRWCRFQMAHMPGGDIIVSGQDITRIKEAEERIRHMALHDSLTGLPNRQLFQDRLDLALAHAKRYETMVGVLYIDVNDFKKINDSLGHAAGDQALRIVAERLTASVRGPDTVARLGGDEFVVILPEILQPSDVAEVARRVLAAMVRPVELSGRLMPLGASIGVSLYPSDATTPDELLLKADQAMYRAKSGGGSNYRFNDSSRTEAAPRQEAERPRD